MPPKTHQAKLPRRHAARSGEMDLEAAAEERIDAVTAEPLIEGKYIEILSPDKTLRLFYNVSTLVRIACDKGGFVQPPHFRERMHPSIISSIEEIEGKRFRFEKRDTFVSADGNSTQLLHGLHSVGGGTSGTFIHHRHVYFDQIIDEFYHLSPAEVYVCPVCYDHYVATRYAPSEGDENAPAAGPLEEGGAPVVDPLDVLADMLGGAVDVDNDDEGAAPGLEWCTPLAHIVFRRANDWKRHMNLHHAVTGTSAADYRLRDVLCTYFSHFNTMHRRRHERKLAQYSEAPPKLALTQQRYWQLNARYNCLRYNRVVEAAELAASHPAAVEEMAFADGEEIGTHATVLETVESDGDFIVDDEESSDGRDDDGYGPRFEGVAGFSSDNEESAEDTRQKLRKKRPRSVPAGSGNRKLKRVRADSKSDTSSASPSVTSSSDDADDTDEELARKSVQRQQTLFQTGLLKEKDCYFQRLSAEDRRFFVRASTQNHQPSALYDPIMHRRRVALDVPSEYDDIDWAAIGEELTPAATAPSQKSSAEAEADAESGTKHSQRQILLSDKDEEDGSDSSSTSSDSDISVTEFNTQVASRDVPAGGGRVDSEKPPAARRAVLLLDDEDDE